MRLGQAYVLGHGTFVVLLPLCNAAEFKPRRRRHAVPASVGILLEILPSGFSILSFEVQLAQHNRGLQVRRNVLLTPVELPQYGIGVNGIWFRSYVLLKNCNTFLELSLFQEFRSLHYGWFRSPSDFVLDDRVSLVLQTGVRNDECAQGSEDKSSDVRPVSDSGRLPEQATVENLHEKPQRQEPVSCGLESNPEDQHVPKHFNFEFGKTH